MVMNLGNDWKNINSSARDGIFAKTSRCDTGAHRGQVASGERKKFGAPVFESKVFWD